MLRLFIQLAFVACILSPSFSLAASCKGLFAKQSQIKQGDQVEVSLVDYSINGIDGRWEAGTIRSLIYLGRLTKSEDAPELFIFADKNLNTYYLSGHQTAINGRRADNHYTPAHHLLPPILRQTTGSCNMCANITSINTLAMKKGMEPLRLSAQKLEQDKALNQFSHQEAMSIFLNKLYDAAWPEGFKEGLDPKFSFVELIKASKEFNSSLIKSTKVSISESSPEAATQLPISANVKTTLNAEEFLQHIRNGGSAVIAGMVDPTATQKVTNLGLGYQLTIPKAGLTPYQNFKGFLGWVQRVKLSIKKAKASTVVLEKILNGIKPTEKMTEEYMYANSSEVGHAVAAVGYIQSGPLKGHIIISNSWGLLEVYSPSSFVDNIQYRLYHSIEKRP